MVFLQSLLRYACSVLYFYFFVVAALPSFPDAVSIILRKKHADSLSMTRWKEGEVLTVQLRYCAREARRRCLCCTPNQTSSRSFMRREAAAFWLCPLPHQHHFQAPAMHLSVAEGAQGERAHGGHGAAPAPLAVTGSAGNVLCAGAGSTRLSRKGGSGFYSRGLCQSGPVSKQGSKGQEKYFGAHLSPETARLSSTIFIQCLRNTDPWCQGIKLKNT